MNGNQALTAESKGTYGDRSVSWNGIVVAAVLTLVCVLSGSIRAADLDGLIKLSGLNPGLVVVLEPEDVGRFATGQRAGCLVELLFRDADSVQAARAVIAKTDRSGRVTARDYDGVRLPYVDNLVNLVVVESESQLSPEEIVRVLAPRGAALIRQDANTKLLSGFSPGGLQTQSGFARIAKSVPPDTDDWTHYLYDASNNAVSKDRLVGPPRRIQWVGSPKRTRHHDHIASVSAVACAEGRLFFVQDTGSSRSIHLPPNWSLVARDAFNGRTLWTRDIPNWVNPLWPLKSGPATTPRRLVAIGNEVFVTLGIDAPVSLLDAMTGKQVRVFPETRFARELIVVDRTLLCVTATRGADYDAYIPSKERSPQEEAIVDKRWGERNEMRRIVAVDPDSGAVRWQVKSPVTDLTLAASNGRAFFHDGSRIHALDLKTGDEIWASEPLDPVAVRSPSYGPDLLATPQAVLFAGGDRRVRAFAAKTGKVLWEAPHPPSGYRSPEDLFVIGQHVLAAGIRNIRPSSKGQFLVNDLLTGKQEKVFPADTMGHFPHHRCYRSKATEKYILTSRTGIEFVDTATGHWQNQHWVRGGCLVGVIPANGLVYSPPHHCACFADAKLEGFYALGPGPVPTFEMDDSKRLHTGPAYQRLRKLRVATEQLDAWPMHRHDPARSSFTPAAISSKLVDGWTALLGGRLTSPVVAGGKVIVAAIDEHMVHAFNSADGKELWHFIAGGRVDSAPTLFQGRAIFGCADGWIYCLDASNGDLAWRFRAAPAARFHGAYDQVESVWPVHGSILLQEDQIYAVAGRSRFTDGGLHLLRIDPFTGEKISETTYDERIHGSGVDLHRQFDRKYQTPEQRAQWIRMSFQAAGVTDILAAEDGHVFMRSFALDFDPQGKTSLGAPPRPKLRVPFGMLDTTWSHRIGWMRWPGPTSRLVVFDGDKRVFGYGFKVRYQVLNTFDHYLYARSLHDRKADAIWPDQKLPFFVDAMALADQVLILAGPRDIKIIDHPEIYKKATTPEFQQKLARQNRILQGDEGAILWAVDARNGRRLAEYSLEHLPAFDGLAVAENGVFMSTVDGHLVSLTGSSSGGAPQ